MANSRTSNSRLLVVGVAVLVVGVLLVLLIIRNSDDPAPEPAPAAAGSSDQSDGDAAAPTDDQTMTPQQLSSARLPLPVEVPDGLEAVGVRANFMRSVAAIPSAGDLVNLYRLPPPVEGQDTAAEGTGVGLPPAGPDAQQVVQGAEVLAVTGPLPSSNDGTLTMVLALEPGDVPSIMTLANDSEVWFTLLPSPEDASDGATDETTEEAA